MTLKLIALLVTAAGAAMLLRLYRPEFAMVLTLAAGAAALACLLPYLSILTEDLTREFSAAVPLDALGRPMFKVVGMAYLAQFAADVCDDCGEKAMAQKIMLAARVGILILCVPSVRYLLRAVTVLLQSAS